jgi:hypothetical protein
MAFSLATSTTKRVRKLAGIKPVTASPIQIEHGTDHFRIIKQPKIKHTAHPVHYQGFELVKLVMTWIDTAEFDGVCQ